MRMISRLQLRERFSRRKNDDDKLFFSAEHSTRSSNQDSQLYSRIVRAADGQDI